MKKIYLAGQNNFGNRGCEALVRSVSTLISEAMPSSTIFCPSFREDLDSKMWPQHGEVGIKFVAAPKSPSIIKWWARAAKVLPIIESFGYPPFSIEPQTRDIIRQSDVLIMTGGDVISLDYGVPTLYEWASFVEQAKAEGVKTMFWGGSIGPFLAKPHVEEQMIRHLKKYDAITVRESETAAYMRKLGIENFVEVTDPAFTLKPESFDVEGLLPTAPNGVVGLNVSPLIRRFRDGGPESQERLDREVAEFARNIVEKHGYAVVFLPHVGPLDGGTWNSDYHYMKGIMDKYGLSGDRMRIAPANLNAAQLKYLISKFRFLIAARTHATIGAFSTLVPTISIAYSVKAKGINKDLFGDTRLVLETPKVSQESLMNSLKLLEQEEDAIRAHLTAVMPEWRKRAQLSAQVLQSVL